MKTIFKTIVTIVILLLLGIINYKVSKIQQDVKYSADKAWIEYYKAEDYYTAVETLLDSITIWYPEFMDTYGEGKVYDNYLETKEELNF